MEDTPPTPPSSPKQENSTPQDPSVSAAPQPIKRGPGRPRKYPLPPTYAPPPITPSYAATPYNNSPAVLDEMQKYLMKKKVKKYVQKYVQKYAPSQPPSQPAYHDTIDHEEEELEEEPDEEPVYQENPNLSRHRYAHSVGRLPQPPAKGSKLAQILGYK